jgi:hypothetical protein
VGRNVSVGPVVAVGSLLFLLPLARDEGCGVTVGAAVLALPWCPALPETPALPWASYNRVGRNVSVGSVVAVGSLLFLIPLDSDEGCGVTVAAAVVGSPLL